MKKAASSRLQQKSPAEFFAENKNIAGFDNVSAAVLCVQVRLHATIALPPVAALLHVCMLAAGQMLVHDREGACGELSGCC